MGSMRTRQAFYGLLALLIVFGAACSSDEVTPAASGSSATPAASSSTPTPTETSTAPASDCTKANATDLSADDPWSIIIEDFKFKPDCFIPNNNGSSIIKNKDDTFHTFTIDGTVVDASLRPHGTYRHKPDPGLLPPGTYAFHCSIHPQITGTMIVV